MRRDRLGELLTAHADALNEGEEIAPQILARFPEFEAELEPLLQLASSLKATLKPVAIPISLERPLWIPESYKVKAPIVLALPSRRKMVWVTVAATGSILSIAGLFLWFLRRFRSGESEAPAPTAI